MSLERAVFRIFHFKPSFSTRNKYFITSGLIPSNPASVGSRKTRQPPRAPRHGISTEIRKISE